MILREAIKLNTGKVVRIGAQSAFIYVDKVTRATPKVIERLSEREYENLKRLIKENKLHLENFEPYWEDLTRKRVLKKVKECKFSKIASSVDEELSKCERDKKRDRKQTEHNIKKFTERHEKFIPFLDREVKDMYHSEISDDIIIYFKGVENGDFWDYEEYKEFKNEIQTT